MQIAPSIMVERRFCSSALARTGWARKTVEPFFSCTVLALSSAGLSFEDHLSKKRYRLKIEPGRRGEKRERYLCAIPTLEG